MTCFIPSLQDLTISHIVRYHSDLQLNLPRSSSLCIEFHVAEILLMAWQKLKLKAPQGPLDIPTMMFEVESSLRSRKKENYSERTGRLFSPILDALHLPQSLKVCMLFIELFRKIEFDCRRMGISFSLTRIPVNALDFEFFQLSIQQIEGIALKCVWERLCDAVPNLPRQVYSIELMRQILHMSERQALIEAVQELDLSGLELQVLPPEIRLFRGLQALDLSDNSLKRLPCGLFGSLSLNKLSLANNHLEDVCSVGEALQLQQLDLSDNHIRALPDSFAGLKALESLCLRKNQLQKIPEWIGDLSHLHSCDFDYNQLAALPASFVKLTQMEWLSLSFNYFKVFPGQLTFLRNIESLNLSHNQISSLPGELTQNLTRLHSLDLSWNTLNSLPNAFGLSTSLTQLDLSNNPIERLPASFGNLSSLSNLQMSHLFYLSVLPETFGKLEALESLNLAGTQIASFPPHFGELGALTSFVLSKTALREIPESFRALALNLEDVNLSGNDLRDLPSWFLESETLTRLVLFDETFLANNIVWMPSREPYNRDFYKKCRDEFFQKEPETHLGRFMRFFAIREDQKAKEEWEKAKQVLESDPAFDPFLEKMGKYLSDSICPSVDWPKLFCTFSFLRKEQIYEEVSRLSGDASDGTERFLWQRPLAFYDALELTSSGKRKIQTSDDEGSPRKKLR